MLHNLQNFQNYRNTFDKIKHSSLHETFLTQGGKLLLPSSQIIHQALKQEHKTIINLKINTFLLRLPFIFIFLFGILHLAYGHFDFFLEMLTLAIAYGTVLWISYFHSLRPLLKKKQDELSLALKRIHSYYSVDSQSYHESVTSLSHSLQATIEDLFIQAKRAPTFYELAYIMHSKRCECE